MSISSTTRKTQATGNGVATAFAFSFKVFQASDLLVVLTNLASVDTTQTLTTNYTVALNANQDSNPGGTVTMLVAPASGYRLTIASQVPQTQPVVLTNTGGFYPTVINDGLDRQTILSQQLADASSRALTLPVSAPTGISATLPLPSAGSAVGWNSAANALENLDPETLVTIVAYGTARADTFSGTGSQTVFTLLANPGAINNLDVSISGVTQRPGIDYTWSTGTTLTFTSAPPAGTNNILVRYLQALAQGTSDSASAAFIQAGTGAVNRVAQDKMRESVSVPDFGGVADGKYISDATMTIGQFTVTSASGPFTASDVGKRMLIWGAAAGTDSLVGTIASYQSADQVTLNTACGQSVAGVAAHYGTDNYAAFRAAVAYLVTLGGGTLTAPGTYLICHGADGAANNNQWNLNLSVCDNITFDFTKTTFLGCFIGNEYTALPDTTVIHKNKNVNLIGGVFRVVGDRVDAPNSSNIYNMITFVYAEDVKIIDPTIYVPAGARAVSIQSTSTVGSVGDTTKLKNIMLDGYLIIGPTDSATQYLSDGIDLMTDNVSNIWQNIVIGDGQVINVGRGLVAGSGGVNATYNKNLTIGNLQIVNPRSNGASICNCSGLTIGSLAVIGQGKSASASTQNGYGVRLGQNDLVNIGLISIYGESVSGLLAGLYLYGTGPVSTLLGDVYVDTASTSNKWAYGITLSVDDVVINHAVVSNSTSGLNNGTKRMVVADITFRDCTANFDAAVTLPNQSVVDARSMAFSTGGAPVDLYTRPGFNASSSTIKANVTGDGTIYDVVFDAEAYDNLGNYNNATGVFTAPVAGHYQFHASVGVQDLAVTHTGLLLRMYGAGVPNGIPVYINPYPISASGVLVVNASCIVAMSAGQTMKIGCQVTGGTKVVDVLDSYTFFSGQLIR